MTTPHNFAKNKRWINTNHKTNTLHRHPKKLKPTEAYLFDLFPTLIFTDIEIWVSGLEHRDKFKTIVSRINFMYNPITFTIPREIWTPYHNLGFHGWYNVGSYQFSHRRIPLGSRHQ